MVHWARKVMNGKTGAILAGLDHPNMDSAEISGGRSSRFPWRSFTRLDYPVFDVCAEGHEAGQFDCIVIEQVLEHVLYPYRAMRNIHHMLRPGGTLLVTLPFLIKIHKHPVDCSRWTPLGLQYFLQECGFAADGIQVDSWGNRDCVVANFDAYVSYDPALHSLDNDPLFPIVVWGTARK
jgi:SAM-dependent methyltransferase